ncbi:SusC/RagA family TonB-linked outer membrane protein [Sphingobacterium sp. DK4209]|uniref:SusC/RagA family TonB-linked outer membrane protein n=1 Tax=Sphingobacterium zhuxiongii TaxID=2662364 RepID=A0A5Q0QDR4_9SPHI|nr:MULTISPECIES: TonB-dependent receptor [unclassified Sphingobacterium]MVZ64741.1 SusC/RagA family TonB-linked outer membrane protein [Sphingobacterium sp. DK4209]QGA27071.1 SusC/RagA family TonB-linked outer membrane protein [Sphingobacterium sp. dk4302]
MKNIGVLRYFSLLLWAFSLLISQLYAQDKPKPIINASLEGVVLDSLTRQPIEGVTIQLEAVTHAVKTDRQGRFQFVTGQKLPFTIQVAYLGYKSKKLVINVSPAEILLTPSSEDLDEVVVVGYGTQRRRDLTGAVASLPESFLKQKVSSVDQALKGAVSGVQVTQTSGQPGAGVSIRVRGGASIQGGNEPLYVIDGFPVYNQTESTGVNSGTPVNPLASINPSDIESVEVMKDAAATAIYGSRGANGVILISTKKGKAGRVQLNYDGSAGWQSVVKQIDVLNATAFANLRNEVLYDTNPSKGKNQYLTEEKISELGEGTNWQKEAFRVGQVQNHQLSLTGGAERVQYYLGANYLDQEGVIINTDFKRLGFRSNIQAKPFERLDVAANLTVNKTNSQIAPSGIVNALLIMPPTATVYEPDGTYTLRNPFENIFANPIATLRETENQSNNLRVLGTTYAQYQLAKGLSAKVLFGVDLSNRNDKYYLPSYIYEGAGSKGNAILGNLENQAWLNENTLTYSGNFGQHDLNVLVGFTQQESTTSLFNAGASNFVTDELLYNSLQSGSVIIRPNSDAYNWVLHSFLSRINYNYANKYYASASIRRDGSSRFGKNNKWGNFPSLALSWRTSKEDFFSNLLPVINDLKFRASFGATGNQEIGQYQSLATLYALNYFFGNQVLTGFASQRVPNAELGWETTYQYDAGIDVAFLQSRIQISADYYYKRTKDLLLSVEIPWTSGYGTSLQNFGSVSNKGVELSIKTRNIQGNFDWDSDLNVSFNRNKVLSIGDGSSQYISGNYLIAVGKPLGTFYGTATDGILQTGEEVTKGIYTGNATPKAGDRLYKDIDADGKFTAANDRTIIGNAQADLIFGFSNNLSYKGFDLSFLIQGTLGNQILNINRQNLEMFTGQQNASIDALDRWTPTNPSQSYPRAKLDPAPIFSDQFVESGSFLRLANVRFAYSLPKTWLNDAHVNQAQLYFTGQNLLTISNYRGFDPEVTSGSNVQIGTDAGIYPAAKSLSLGLSLTF